VGGQTVAFGQTEADETARDVLAPPQPNQAHPATVEEQIDQMAYGKFGNAAAAKVRLEQLVGLRVENIERVCGITGAQKKKIELAGKGDIKRFLDSIEEKRRRLVAATGEKEEDRVREELSASSWSLENGLFDEGSLFVKMVKKSLSQDQLARYQSDRHEARAFEHQAHVEAVVGIFERTLGFDDEQRRRLKSLLLAETRLSEIDVDHRAAVWFVLAQAVNIPESKLQPILTNSQRGQVTRFFAELKEGLADELEKFESARRGAAHTDEDPEPDHVVKPAAAQPNTPTTGDRPANAKNN